MDSLVNVIYGIMLYCLYDMVVRPLIGHFRERVRFIVNFTRILSPSTVQSFKILIDSLYHNYQGQVKWNVRRSLKPDSKRNVAVTTDDVMVSTSFFVNEKLWYCPSTMSTRSHKCNYA